MASLRSVANWHPATPFFYGWLVIGLVALGSFVATSIAGVVLGGIQGLIIDDTGWSRASIGLAAGVGLWGTGLSGPLLGRLVDRYGARKLMPAGTLILGLFLIFMLWAHSFWQFFVIAVAARIISQPILIGVVPRTVAVNFFRRRRNIALSVISVFRPFSGAMNIQLFALLAMVHGWRATFHYLGIFSLALTLPMLLLIRRRPEDIGLLPDGAVQSAESGGGAATQASLADQGTSSPRSTPFAGPGPTEDSWTAREALRTQAFWLVAFTAFLSTTAHTSIGFSLVPYLREAAGLSNSQAAGVLSISTALVLSNLGWGYLAERIGPRAAIVVSTTIAILLTGYLFTVNSTFGAYLFGVLWGIGTSSTEVLIAILMARYYGRSSYGTIVGALRPFEAAGLGLGSILGGAIYDLTNSYQGLFIEAAAASFVALLLILKATAPVRPAGSESALRPSATSGQSPGP